MPLIAVHLFVFYFGILADLTPPVALACFAAAPIARESGLKISFEALKIAAAGFVVPFMAVLKHPDANAQALAELQTRWEAAVEGNAHLHVIANANNVSLLPRALGKAQAVRWLRDTHFPHATLTLGLGDSVSDLPFMRECDFALTPAHGQLLWAVAGLHLPQR